MRSFVHIIVHATDKAVKAFYHTTQWYNQKSLQWDYMAEAATDKKFVESLK